MTATASAKQSKIKITPVECFVPNKNANKGRASMPTFCIPAFDMPIKIAQRIYIENPSGEFIS